MCTHADSADDPAASHRIFSSAPVAVTFPNTPVKDVPEEDDMLAEERKAYFDTYSSSQSRCYL